MPKALIVIAGLVIAALAGVIYVNTSGTGWRSALRLDAPNKPVIIQQETKSNKQDKPLTPAKEDDEKIATAKPEAETEAEPETEVEVEVEKAAAKRAEEIEAERLAAESAAKAEAEKLAAEKAANAEAAKLSAEKLAAEKAAAKKEKAEKLAIEQAVAEKAAAKKAEEEKMVAEAEKSATEEAISPAFDIVRVEEDGSALAAGRAEPGSSVTLSINGKPVGQTQTNPRGEWVLVLEQPIKSGPHQLTLQSEKSGTPPKTSKQAALVNMPESGTEKPLIVLADDTSGSKILQAPAPASKSVEQDTPAENNQPGTETATQQTEPQKTQPEPKNLPEPKSQLALSLGSVDYGDTGAIVFSGRATPGEPVRLYVDNAPLADATSDKNGNWIVTATRKISPGQHALRVDQITKAGKVVSRVQLPFYREQPARVATLLKSRETGSATVPLVEPEKTEDPETEKTQKTANAASASSAVQPKPTDSAPTPPMQQSMPQSDEKEPQAAQTSASPAPLAGAPAIEPRQTTPQSTASASSVPEAGSQPTASTNPSIPPTAQPATSPVNPQQAAPANASPTPMARAPAVETPQAATQNTLSASGAPEAGSQPTASADPSISPTAQPATSSVNPQQAASASASPTATAPSAGTPQGAPTDASPAAQDAAPPSELPQTAQSEPTAPPISEAPALVTQSPAAAPDAATDPENKTPNVANVLPGQVVIQPGNNLWRISRVIYGRGVRYSVIYQANKDQIRDPALIFPGQIFTTPGVTPPPSIDPKRRDPIAGASDPLAEDGAEIKN